MSREVVEALAWALIHFTWQGALVGLAAALACASIGKARPQARYAALVAALAVMAATPVATTIFLLTRPEAAAAATTIAAVPAVAAAEASMPSAADPAPISGSRWLSMLVANWSGIAAFLSLRSFGGWLRLRALIRRNLAPVEGAVERTAGRLAERLGIRRAVKVVLSTAVEVPGVVGWLKPVVLLPVSVATALTPEQIAQILAHELAHVRRHDYLVNLFQTAVENVLFYHPAVWWISAQARAERENCCDDLAVATCGDAAGYARTLAQLETMRGAAPALLPAASGGSLLARVRRLLARGPARRPVPGWLGLVVPLAIVALAFVAIPAPRAETDAPAPRTRPGGYLAGLVDAGYTNVSVEDIIMLKNHGVQPAYIKAMLGAGLGALTVEQLVRLHDNGVRPDYAASAIASELTAGLDVPSVIRFHQNGVRPETMSGIRALGFGPYAAEDVIRLAHNGVDVATFRALKDVSGPSAPAEHAIRFRHEGVTPATIREAERQGFKDLTFEQVLKLRRAGVI